MTAFSKRMTLTVFDDDPTDEPALDVLAKAYQHMRDMGMCTVMEDLVDGERVRLEINGEEWTLDDLGVAT